jgi:hypothetical protein
MKRYAVGGEVGITPVQLPHPEPPRKMEVVIRADIGSSRTRHRIDKLPRKPGRRKCPRLVIRQATATAVRYASEAHRTRSEDESRQ